MRSTKKLSMKQCSYHHNIIFLINIFLLVLSILAIFKSIFISFDIDEGYAIAQSYRLIVGDRLFAEMWEPHQLSAFFSGILMLPYLMITGGDTTGIIIYLRILGTLIHLLIGIWFYQLSKKQFNTTVSLLISLIHINFLPKWLSIPEFEIMHYWSMCIIFLSLLSWKEQQKNFMYLVLSSVALFVAVTCYPTMLLLYPVYVTAIWHFSNEGSSAKWRSIFWFTLPALLLGLTFIGYLLSYLSPSEFLENISYILMDESHSNTLSYRCGEYLKEIIFFAIPSGIYLAISLLIGILLKRVLSSKGKISRHFSELMLPTILLLSISFLSIAQLISSVLGDTNQFYLYCRFFVIAMLGIICAPLAKKENAPYLFLGIVPGILSVIASAAITNMTLGIALARIYIAVMASCFISANLLQKKFQKERVLHFLVYASAILFLMSLLMSKLLLVRVTGCIPISVKMHTETVTDGPAAGLLLKEELAQAYNENTAFIKANITKEDSVLYFGCENIYYLIGNADIATPSTQGTASFNEMYLTYYEELSEKMPNVVIIDKSFGTDPYYYYSEQNHIVLEWIEKEFENATVVETDRLILLRLPSQKKDELIH